MKTLLLLCLLGLAACRGCAESAANLVVETVRGGPAEGAPGGRAEDAEEEADDGKAPQTRRFVEVCTEDMHEESRCKCIAKELGARFDVWALKAVVDAIERRELPHPGLADSVDACGGDSDPFRRGRPWGRESVVALTTACQRHFSETVCGCAIGTLEPNVALVEILGELEASAAGRSIDGGLLAGAVTACSNQEALRAQSGDDMHR